MTKNVTQSKSSFICTTPELRQRDGTFYGTKGLSNNVILYNRLLEQNYNGLIFGKPGEGKAFRVE